MVIATRKENGEDVKMMNVYEDVEAKEVESIDVIDVFESGNDIIENYRDLIEELMGNEQDSLLEAVFLG